MMRILQIAAKFFFLAVTFAFIAYMVSGYSVSRIIGKIESRQAAKIMENLVDSMEAAEFKLFWQTRKLAKSINFEQILTTKDVSSLDKKYSSELLEGMGLKEMQVYNSSGNLIFSQTNIHWKKTLGSEKEEQDLERIVQLVLTTKQEGVYSIVQRKGTPHFVSACSLFVPNQTSPSGVLLLIQTMENKFDSGFEFSALQTCSTLPVTSYEDIGKTAETDLGYSIVEKENEIFVYTLIYDTFDE
ncbi:MAG: hypothetical protein IK079_01885, partial [Desulfovibrio sp.]|nr:hypothetical protein [Desulfovibrio sp.]